MKEVWKAITGYEGLYSVSNMGRVKSLKRSVQNRGRMIAIQGRVLKQHPSSKGGVYPSVMLSSNGKCTRISVHRLVAYAFISNAHEKPIVNHKNGIKNDNRSSNLEFVTHSENMKHAYRVLGMKPVKGMLGKTGLKHHLSKKVHQLDMSGNLVEKFNSQLEAMRKTGIKNVCISKCCRGTRSHAGGYKWEYAYDVR